ncbi:response regulator [Patescibacteria group bacterium]|nr:response regulator [Patescibacteria group bacterium]
MKTILLAEKEKFLSGIYSYRLRASGFDVLSVVSGTEAMEKFNASDIDLVLINELLPLLSGHEVLRMIRSHAMPSKRAVPVIVLADSPDSAGIDAGLALGANQYLFKSSHTPAEIILTAKKLL